MFCRKHTTSETSQAPLNVVKHMVKGEVIIPFAVVLNGGILAGEG
jgi:hypothetical protein